MRILIKNLWLAITTRLLRRSTSNTIRDISPTYQLIRHRLPLTRQRVRAITEKFIAHRIRWKIIEQPKERAQKRLQEEDDLRELQRWLVILKKDFLPRMDPASFDIATKVVVRKDRCTLYNGINGDLKRELYDYAVFFLVATPLTEVQMVMRQARRSELRSDNIERESHNLILPEISAMGQTQDHDARHTQGMGEQFTKDDVFSDKVSELQVERDWLQDLGSMPTTSEDIEIRNKKRLSDWGK